jgi:ABC-type nickel/cobalt efflux system permease component RcnA
VNATTPALLAAAAGVGFGHAILPDHWVPLAVVGRTRRYPLARVARLSGLAGVTHVLVSILLGAVIIAVGLQLRSTVQGAQDTIIGSVLIITGLGFAILELSGRGHTHRHDHGHAHSHHAHHEAHAHEHAHPHSTSEVDERVPAEENRLHGLAAVMVPFGAAASPDLTILPVFLAASTVGATTAIGSLVIFAAVTVGTIVGLTLLACFGGYQIRGRWLERWGNAVTAVVLILIGSLVLVGAI